MWKVKMSGNRTRGRETQRKTEGRGRHVIKQFMRARYRDKERDGEKETEGRERERRKR